MAYFRPRQVGSGKSQKSLSKMSNWKRSVEQGARDAYRKEQEAKRLTYKSGVGKPKIAQMTFRKMFGKQQSHFSTWIKNQPEYKTLKANKAGLDDYRMLITGTKGMNDGLKHRYIQKYGKGAAHKHYNSAKSIKALAKANGIKTISKAAINMIKMLDGGSAEALIAWHKQKYGERENLPESEVMAFLADQVVPHLQSSVQREEALQKKVVKAHLGGTARVVDTEPLGAWAPKHKASKGDPRYEYAPATGRRPYFASRPTKNGKDMSKARDDYLPVKGFQYQNQNRYQNKGKDEYIPAIQQDYPMKYGRPPSQAPDAGYYGSQMDDTADQRVSKRGRVNPLFGTSMRDDDF